MASDDAPQVIGEDVRYEQLSAVPQLLGLYGRAATEQVPVLGTTRDGRTMPTKGLEVRGIRTDVAQLAAYTRVCGLRLRDELPITYPFLLSFPVAMQLMTGREFPFPAMGSVHLSNVIETRRALHVGEELDLRVRAENLREHPSGLLVDVISEIRADGEAAAAWTQRSTFLSKRRTSLSPPKGAPRPPRPEAPTAADLGDPTVVTEVDTGRIGEYAAVSGDRNPIHISAVGAKAFGFPNVIAHGMWTAAALLGTVEGCYSEHIRYTVEFGKPVVLPARLGVYAREGAADGADGWQLTVRDARKLGTVHATATIEEL